MEKIEDIEENKEEENVEEIPKKKGKGQSRERMMELHKIRSEKALQKKLEKEEMRKKEEEVIKIKKEKLNFEYEEAQKIKEALDKKKKITNEQNLIKNDVLYKTASRDILKDRYLEEAKRRVMVDLFS